MTDTAKISLILAELSKRDDLLALYRFGSWGTEQQHPESDIDVAILTAAPLQAVERWDLEQKLATLVGREVDLVSLLAASTVMRMQVVAFGERLFARDLLAAEEFETRTFADYARLNEERRGILDAVRDQGVIYGQ